MKNSLAILLALLVIASCGGGSGSSNVPAPPPTPPVVTPPVVTDAGRTWSVTAFPAVGWTSVSYTNGKFFATGNFGTVLESIDGLNWASRYAGTPSYLNALNWGNNLYVVAGFGETLAESSNGTTWVSAQPLNAIQADFYALAYGAGKFVAVGIGGTYFSTDGIHWTLANTGTVTNASGIAFGNGLFVVPGGSTGFLTSTDGVNWSTTAAGPCSNPGSVAWDSSGFIALSSAGICLSSDGLTWTLPSSPNPNFSTSMNLTLTASNGHYFILNTTSAWTSTDRINWTQVHSKTDVSYPFTGMAASPSGYVLVGAGNQILQSSDLANWTTVAAGTKGAILAIDYLNGTFVTTGGSNGTTGNLAHSSDGVNWTSQTVAAASLPVAITHSASSFYAVASNAVLASTDGISWNSTPLSLGGSPFSIAYGNGRLVITGSQGLIAASSDGKNWTPETSGLPTNVAVTGVAYGASKFVAVTNQGQVLTSPDGTNWAPGPSGGGIFTSVTYGSEGFVAVGANGVIWQSADGTTWKSEISGSTSGFTSVNFSSGRYVVVSGTGDILTSTDAANWVASTPVTGESLNSIAFGNGKFVAVGNDGVIITSAN